MILEMTAHSFESDNIERYHALDKWDDFKQKLNEGKLDLELEKKYALSFASHVIGITILYHPEVQKRYYELKKDYLSER